MHLRAPRASCPKQLLALAIGLPVLAAALAGCQMPDTVMTQIGNGSQQIDGDGGPADDAGIGKPTAVAADAFGTLYVAGVHGPNDDADRFSSEIRRVDTNGTIRTVATLPGSVSGLVSSPGGTLSFVVADGGRATVGQLAPGGAPAAVSEPFALHGGSVLPALALLPDGVLAYTDPCTNRVMRLDPQLQATSVLAGTGKRGWSGDEGPAVDADLDTPLALAANAAGELFVGTADGRLRTIDTAGTITTVAASIGTPRGLAVGPGGDVFVGARTGAVGAVRRITADGTVSTTVGGRSGGTSTDYGEGGPASEAKLLLPWGLAFDIAGDLLVCDGEIGRVLRVTPPLT